MKFCVWLLIVLPAIVWAQSPPNGSRPTANVLKNGNFERFSDADNLWDGVDQEGFLAGDVGEESSPRKPSQSPSQGIFFQKWLGSVEAILEGGNIGRLAMPISVQVADLNKDGLLDIITVDGAGYFRVYFNSGTPAEPKFTHCEMVPVFLGCFPWIKGAGRFYSDGMKLALGDFTKTGTPDLVLGNYYGDLMIIKNSGTPRSPKWSQPIDINAIRVPTTKDDHRWANLFAPACYDWNKDGKVDVLVGEGSYSANAVHLLLNTSTGFGSRSNPVFTKDDSDYLAYGDGREQLIPAVVDYNGDGCPDLLVGDRTGNINCYLSAGPWKREDELKRMPDPISFGGQTSIGVGRPGARCVAPAAADLNGDGKFDIIIGKPDGRIAVSYNIGTSTEPKFGPLVELKGEKVFPKGAIRAPSDWAVNFGYRQGNFYGYYCVVSPTEDPEAAQTTGGHALKFGYNSVQNKIIPYFKFFFPGVSRTDIDIAPKVGFSTDGISPIWVGVGASAAEVDSNVSILRQTTSPDAILPDVTYTLSFKVKGNGVKDGHASIFFGGWLIRDLAAAKAETGRPDNRACEALSQDFNFSVGPSWTTVSKQIKFHFTQAELNRPEKWRNSASKIDYRSSLDIRAAVNVGNGVFYIGDVQLVPSS